MTHPIDIYLDVYADTPRGKDPDSFSPTLRKYHKTLWSKPLPNGTFFELTDFLPRVLRHKSEVGEFILSSDSIGHTYSRTKSTSAIIQQVPEAEISAFFKVCSTIGAYIIFPANRIENKMTINGARGLNRKIGDRFDLTLECIRRQFNGELNPLSETLERYFDFFSLFANFENYVDFFLLHDLVSQNFKEVDFFLPFNNFGNSPLPQNVSDYLVYKRNVTDFINARNQRILTYSKANS